MLALVYIYTKTLLFTFKRKIEETGNRMADSR
jgi:hypothetical protein